MINTKLSKSEIIDNLKEDISVLVHKHALLAIQNDELKLYINHALDNSKEQLISRIDELEKERDVLTTALATIHETSYDLRQQAKGVEDVIEDFADNDAAAVIYVGDLVSRAEYLKKQADELEQKSE